MKIIQNSALSLDNDLTIFLYLNYSQKICQKSASSSLHCTVSLISHKNKMILHTLVEASVAVDETWSEVIVQARKYTDSASFWPMLFQTFAFG
jgi:hypothetical protein